MIKIVSLSYFEILLIYNKHFISLFLSTSQKIIEVNTFVLSDTEKQIMMRSVTLKPRIWI